VRLPDGFVWGVAGAAHQIEGGNWNNDWWVFEHTPGTAAVEVSGDCCDSLHRYADDCAPRTQRGSRCRRSSQPMWCCAGDRGGPSGIALQGEVSNHRKVRRLRAGVLSVAEKAGGQPVRCEPRRRAKANHSMTRRKRRDDIETGESRCSGMSLVGACLLTRRCPASRWREFGSGSGTERGNLVPDTGPAVQLGEEPPAGESEISKWQKPRGAE
jgi:hypothetical protein